MHEEIPVETRLITFKIPVKTLIELKVMCIIMNKTMSAFIRGAIQEKILTLKEKKDEKNKWV